MDIFDSSGQIIRLDNTHFVAEGGEGRIYALNDKVFKLYHDLDQTISTQKLDELTRLVHPNIVHPIDSVFDAQGQRIGFSMIKVPDGAVGLARLFTSTYWSSNRITPDKIIQLLKEIQKTIAFIHSKGFLQVDGNEFNYLVEPNLKQPFFIDVDSYQTPSSPATAIMPSIRDYSQADFSQQTDWFSFAVVAFQLFTGIHPFKGRHPDFKKNDFKGRIQAKLSVLDQSVSYPSSVRDFSLIPKSYMYWFTALFVHGRRVSPPVGDMRYEFKPIKRVIQDSASLAIKQLAQFNGDIQGFWAINGQQVIQADNILYVGKREYQIPTNSQGFVMAVGERETPIFLHIEKQRFAMMIGKTQVMIESTMAAERIFVAASVAYIINEDNLTEIKIIKLGQRWVAAPGSTRKILPHATTVYNEIVVEDVLGQPHLLLPVRPDFMPIMAVPELKGYRVIEAKRIAGVAILNVATVNGEYRSAIIRFSEDFVRYDIEFREDLDNATNFTVLDKGLVIALIEDGKIEVGKAKPNSHAMRIVEDQQIKSFMHLVNDNGRLGFYTENGFYSMSMK